MLGWSSRRGSRGTGRQGGRCASRRASAAGDLSSPAPQKNRPRRRKKKITHRVVWYPVSTSRSSPNTRAARSPSIVSCASAPEGVRGVSSAGAPCRRDAASLQRKKQRAAWACHYAHKKSRWQAVGMQARVQQQQAQCKAGISHDRPPPSPAHTCGVHAPPHHGAYDVHQPRQLPLQHL